jgi:hypothetical protein
VVAVLLAEVAITLLDFVEEDGSRKLPASERVNHTLLAVNYGAILALLLPVLAEWAARPTALQPASYGLWSGLAALAAIGVALFGLRDLAARAALGAAGARSAGPLAIDLAERRTVLVTGATGFIGRRLVAAWRRPGTRWSRWCGIPRGRANSWSRPIGSSRASIRSRATPASTRS